MPCSRGQPSSQHYPSGPQFFEAEVVIWGTVINVIVCYWVQHVVWVQRVVCQRWSISHSSLIQEESTILNLLVGSKSWLGYGKGLGYPFSSALSSIGSPCPTKPVLLQTGQLPSGSSLPLTETSSLQPCTCCFCQWSRFFARFRTECMLLLYNFLSASCWYLVVYLLSTLWSFVLTISAQNNWTVFPPQNFCSWWSYSVY